MSFSMISDVAGALQRTRAKRGINLFRIVTLLKHLLNVSPRPGLRKSMSGLGPCRAFGHFLPAAALVDAYNGLVVLDDKVLFPNVMDMYQASRKYMGIKRSAVFICCCDNRQKLAKRLPIILVARVV
jgi:hypothetical protein